MDSVVYPCNVPSNRGNATTVFASLTARLLRSYSSPSSPDIFTLDPDCLERANRVAVWGYQYKSAWCIIGYVCEVRDGACSTLVVFCRSQSLSWHRRQCISKIMSWSIVVLREALRVGPYAVSPHLHLYRIVTDRQGTCYRRDR